MSTDAVSDLYLDQEANVKPAPEIEITDEELNEVIESNIVDDTSGVIKEKKMGADDQQELIEQIANMSDEDKKKMFDYLEREHNINPEKLAFSPMSKDRYKDKLRQKIRNMRFQRTNKKTKMQIIEKLSSANSDSSTTSDSEPNVSAKTLKNRKKKQRQKLKKKLEKLKADVASPTDSDTAPAPEPETSSVSSS